MRSAFRAAAAVSVAAGLAGGCASEVVRHPATLSSLGGPAISVATTQAVNFTLDSGYSRSIRSGAEFSVVGAIAEGRVLKPVGGTLTIEGAHTHEAYPVVRDGMLVGFYLPAERMFSPLSRPVSFPTNERRS